MSIEAISWAWTQVLPPTEKLTLLALAMDSNHDEQCWPKLRWLADRTSLSEVQVTTAVKALASAGLLVAEERPGHPRLIHLALAARAQPKLPAKRKQTPAAEATEEMQQALDLYNEMAERCSLPKVRRLTIAHITPLRARLKEGGIDQWREAMHLIEISAHCRGINDRGWKASFGFLLQAKSYANLITGRYGSDYEEKSNGGTRTTPAGRGDARLDGLRRFDSIARKNPPGGAGRRDGGAQGRGEPGSDGGGEGEGGPGDPPRLPGR